MPTRSKNPITEQRQALDRLFKETETQLEALRTESKRQLTILIQGLIEGDLAELRHDLRRSVERSRSAQQRTDADTLQRLLFSQLFGGGQGTGLTNPSALQQGGLVYELLERSLRNL